MKRFFFVFLLVVAESKSENVNEVLTKLNTNKNYDWWQNAVFYQIYPRSFKDSNNDGIGDLRGIIEKIDHFSDLGVDAIWLSPMFKSPMIDGGYDISDYRDVAPEYGTLDDFKELLEKAHKRGIKVVLDLVPNHTSDQHEWFNKSVSRVKGYEDYYTWADAKFNEKGERMPPNNWISVFRNSGWTWSEERKQYYFHQFTSAQPDLNFYSEKVQQEIKDVMKYWLDMGVDGFRVDAVPHVYEDRQLRDEPVDPDSNTNDTNNWNYLKHIYTKDQPETFELVYSWREFLDNYTKTNGGDTRIFMTECATSIDKLVLYYGNEKENKLGAHFTFNFNFLGLNQNSTPNNVISDMFEWFDNLPKIYTVNWLTGNHDNRRIGSKVGERNIDGYNMLLMFLPRVSITYMAEEIGQLDGEVTCKEGQDPSAITDCDTFNETSRDFERTPFQWDNSTNAGFNNGAKTWLPVSRKYTETNLAKQKNDNRSHYHIYKQMVNLKLKLVSFETLITQRIRPGPILGLTRLNSKLELYALRFNMGNDVKTTHILINDAGPYVVEVSSVNADYLPGDQVQNKITLKPGDCVILRKLVN